MATLRGAVRALQAGLMLLCLVPADVAAAGPKVLALVSQNLPPYREALEGFRNALKSGAELDVYYLETEGGTSTELAKKAAASGADLVFAVGSQAAMEARRHMPSLPLVVGMVLNKRDLPGSNGPTTGVVLEHPLEVQFRYLRRLMPEAKRVGVLYNSEENERIVSRAVKVAASQGLELLSFKVATPEGIPGALESLSRRVDVIWTVQDNLLLNVNTASGVLLFSFRNRIPIVGLSPSWVKAGALYSLGWDYSDIGRQCAEMALGILETGGRGSIPPPASPRRVYYSLNMKTAARMKLEVPAPLINEAQEVIR